MGIVRGSMDRDSQVSDQHVHPSWPDQGSSAMCQEGMDTGHPADLLRMLCCRANGKAPSSSSSSSPQQEAPEVQLLVSSPREAAAAAAGASANGDAEEEGLPVTGASVALQWS
jgi:hypothetical protein